MIARRAPTRRGQPRHLGQVVVEMLLILPVFLTIVFTIMELGNVAFWVIVLNHATYEVARIGALRAGPDPGANSSGLKDVNGIMNDKIKLMISGARVDSKQEPTLVDRQANQQNFDLVVTGTYNVRLLFPISSIMLASSAGSGRKTISTTVRMPIEQPLSR
jgi:Flp pilus assembly protein TadG